MGRRGTLPFYRKESSGERICVRLSCLFLNVYVYIYIFESIREDQLFQGTSVCTSGARAAAVWIKQAGSFPVLHTATTAASNRVLWQVYKLVLCYSVLPVSCTVTLNPSKAVTLYTWKMSRSLPSEYFCAKCNTSLTVTLAVTSLPPASSWQSNTRLGTDHTAASGKQWQQHPRDQAGGRPSFCLKNNAPAALVSELYKSLGHRNYMER